jgi:D-alanyl-D-alanine carboxypeptidase
MTVEQAIHGLVTKSANDVAVAVAEHVAGSEARFAARMTARARQLGMASTRFANASGLPDTSQVTTARDVAVLSQALIRDFPQYYTYFQTSDFSYRKVYARNHNALLGRVEGVDGIKTGYTRASGFNLASSAVRDGRRIFAVVLGGETARARDNQMAHLIDMAFETLHNTQTPTPPTITYAAMPVNRVIVQPPAPPAAEAVAPPRTGGLFSLDTSVEQGDADQPSYVVPMPFAPIAPRVTDVAPSEARALRGTASIDGGPAS